MEQAGPETIEAKRAALEVLLRARMERAALRPLTDAQQGLWFHQAMYPDSTAYNMPLAFCLHGPVRDAQATIRHVLETVIARHPALRTVFVLDGERPRQKLLDRMPVELPVEARPDLSGPDWRARIPELTRGQSAQPFRLAEGPLFRFRLVAVSADLHVLLATFHHIAMDGWSIGVFLKDFAHAFISRVRGTPLSLDSLAASQFDYATQQQSPAHQAKVERDLAYWQARLAGAPVDMALPTDFRRGGEARGAILGFDVDGRTATGLWRLAQGLGATPFMIMLATVQVFLARVSGQDDLVLGVSVSNRDDRRYRDVVGLFSDVLPMRGKVDVALTFTQYLARVKAQCLQDYEHAQAPLTRIIERVRPARGSGKSPLFQAGFDFQNTPWPAILGDHVSMINGDAGAAKLDFNLNLSKVGDALSGVIEYDAGLFARGTIDSLARAYSALLDSILASPDTSLGRLEMRGDDAPAQAAAQAAAMPGSVPARIRRQARLSPARCALEQGDRRIDYAELDRRSDDVAAALLRAGVAPGDRVGACFASSLEFPIALLGAWKAGVAYVPLDPAMPGNRRDDIVADAAIATVLTTSALSGSWADHPGVAVIAVDACAARDEGFAPREPGDDDIAYVIYTSGSTGRPKGVEVGHGALAAWLAAIMPVLGLDSDDRVLQFASVSFDTSAEEIFPALASGATLVVPDGGRGGSVQGFLDWCGERRISVLDLPTAYWHEVCVALQDAACRLPDSVRTTIIGGEAASPRALARWQAAVPGSVRLVNTYGPTETTVSVIAADLAALPDVECRAVLPIGRPYPGVRAYILDEHGRQVPDGVAGELAIGGPTLAQGYRSLPELTADRFVPDPFDPRAGARMYRTGDFVRRRADGDIEFIGRRDDQVKVSGFRVELGDIEAALARCPGIAQATAMLLPAGEGEGDRHRLAAFLVPADGSCPPSADDVRGWARRGLPGHMVPASYAFLAALPRTISGKVDRAVLAALPRPDVAVDAVATAPRNREEAFLAETWSDLLGVEVGDVHANFFDLGGHSLLVIRMLSRVRSAFGIEITLAQAFAAPTVAELAVLLAQRRVEGAFEDAGRIPRAPRGDAAVPQFRQSMAQRSLWILHRLDPGSTAYNNPSALELEGRLDADALASSLAALVERHEILRTVFADVDGEPVQRVLARVEVPVERFDLSELPASEAEAALKELVDADAGRPFDLENGPLLRLAIVSRASDRHVLLFNWHHIVTDAWSAPLFVSELVELYRSKLSGTPPALSPPPLQYADFSEWQLDTAASDAMTAHRAYWKQALEGAPARVDLPAAASPDATSRRSGRVTLAVSAAVRDGLSAVASARGATLFMVALSALKLLLYRYSGQPDIVVGTPMSWRSRQELECVLGYFINTLVLRTDLSLADTFDAVLDAVRATAIAGYEHRHLAFEQVVADVLRERAGASTPLFNVSFVLTRSEPGRMAFPGAEVRLRERGRQQAKFDLTLAIEESPDGMSCEWEYPEGLFAPALIEGMAREYTRLLEVVAQRPDIPLAELELLDASGRACVRAFGEGGAVEVGADSLPARIRRVARSHPQRIAVVSDGQSLTYADLDARADALSRTLERHGAGTDRRVGVCLERSLHLPVALLAAWKAGAAYVPIEPDAPPRRILAMLRDADAVCAVAQGALADALAADGIAIVDPDVANIAVAADHGVGGAAMDPKAGDLAYVIFTSGSTGQPKGVMVEHGSLANLWAGLETWLARAGVPEERRWAWNASVAFDASLQAIAQWASGATVHLLPSALRRDPSALRAYLREHAIDVLDATPLLASALLEGDGGQEALPCMVIGGEAINHGLWRDLVHHYGSRGVAALNVYGPTEATIDATAALVAGDSPTLGGPLANVRCHVVDPYGGLLPSGVPGELWIAGAGIARGYLRDRQEDRRRFAPLPSAAETRAYRTGDRACWSEDGRLAYLGRVDDQAKIRGYRVEPAEVASRIARCPGVADCAVLCRADAVGLNALVAYVVPAAGVAADDAWLDAAKAGTADWLPDYMMPSYWMVVDALPRNRNGKLDRAALPEPARAAGAARIPLAGRWEHALAAIWASLLGMDPAGIGASDNFFQLGGNSLLVMRMINAIRQAHGCELPVRGVFVAPDLRRTAEQLQLAMATTAAEAADAGTELEDTLW